MRPLHDLQLLCRSSILRQHHLFKRRDQSFYSALGTTINNSMYQSQLGLIRIGTSKAYTSKRHRHAWEDTFIADCCINGLNKRAVNLEIELLCVHMSMPITPLVQSLVGGIIYDAYSGGRFTHLYLEEKKGFVDMLVFSC